MHTRHCLKIAHRIDALLSAELGQGVHPERMVADGLYARDVLLVCEGFARGELPQLAERYRTALAAPEEAPKAASPSGGRPAPAKPAEPPRRGKSAKAPNGPKVSGRDWGRISGFFSSIFAPTTQAPSTNTPSTIDPPQPVVVTRQPASRPRPPR